MKLFCSTVTSLSVLTHVPQLIERLETEGYILGNMSWNGKNERKCWNLLVSLVLTWFDSWTTCSSIRRSLLLRLSSSQ